MLFDLKTNCNIFECYRFTIRIVSNTVSDRKEEFFEYNCTITVLNI